MIQPVKLESDIEQELPFIGDEVSVQGADESGVLKEKSPQTPRVLCRQAELVRLVQEIIHGRTGLQRKKHLRVHLRGS